MNLSARPTSLAEIAHFRELYRREMNCQIIHDSLHFRPNWTRSWLLLENDAPVGYGSIAIAGPWKDKPTAFEFFILPAHRQRSFDFFEIFLRASNPIAIETQSNDPLMTPMLHTFAQNMAAEAILFHDKITTTLTQPGIIFRRANPDELIKASEDGLDTSADYVLDENGKAIATGGILYHYNPPYGDIFMAVALTHRRRGLGAFMVQELKRTCHELGKIPAARCNVNNLASRKTLQKAGFVPCGNIIAGTLPK
jgi:RimJ/RimL family protein N-acetyltransferase